MSGDLVAYHAARGHRDVAERNLAEAQDRYVRRPDAVSLLALQAARARAERAVLDEKRARREASLAQGEPLVPAMQHRTRWALAAALVSVLLTWLTLLLC